jgi:hypothetical protein
LGEPATARYAVHCGEAVIRRRALKGRDVDGVAVRSAAERRGLANRGGHPCQAHEVPSYRKLRSPKRYRANICYCFIHTEISDKIDQAMIGSPKRRRTRKLTRSRVMTFLVNHQGNVYEKDLGSNTARIAAGMTAFNPDNTWRGVTDATQPPTGAK